MKKTLLLSAVAALLLSAVSAIVYVNNERDSMDDLFSANVEALAEGEIIVGNLCVQCPNSACSSLGEVFLEHFPA